MSDLISRQEAIDAINRWDKFGVDERNRIVRWHEGLVPYVHLRDVLAAIVNLPSAQPEIIRCKDCLYGTEIRNYQDAYYCRNPHQNQAYLVHSMEFCSYAERKDNE